MRLICPVELFNICHTTDNRDNLIESYWSSQRLRYIYLFLDFLKSQGAALDVLQSILAFLTICPKCNWYLDQLSTAYSNPYWSKLTFQEIKYHHQYQWLYNVMKWFFYKVDSTFLCPLECRLIKDDIRNNKSISFWASYLAKLEV